MKRPRLVFVANALRLGGSQSVMLELVHAALAGGFEVVVATRGGEMGPAFEEEGARVVTLVMREGAADSGAGLASISKTLASTLGLAQLAALSLGKRTIFQASQPWPVALSAVVARATGSTHIWLAHGTSNVEMPPPWLSVVRRESDIWVAITPEVESAMLALRPRPQTQLIRIPNPVRFSELNAAPPVLPGSTGGVREVGLVSTLTENKGGYVRACILAVDRMSRRGDPVDLKIVGSGAEKEPLAQLARELQLTNPRLRVTFLGSHLDPWPLFSPSALIIGMGLVALEAAGRGFNVVCASSDGIGGQLSTKSYPRLYATNFTGRGMSPLTVPELESSITYAIRKGKDPSLQAFVRATHGNDARRRWIRLWERLL